MSSVDGISGTLDHLGISSKTKDDPKSNELGQTAFLELMITQLNNQDPLNPQENSEFIAQLAQFSSVEGIERLNSNFETFAGSFSSNRALEASSLVGRQVSVPGNETYLLDGQLVSATATIPATTTDLNVNIYSESGELIQSFPLGAQESGDVAIRWDGLYLEKNGEIVDHNGGRSEPVGPGVYRVEVLASQDGKMEEMDTAVSANVNSVTVDPSGAITLNLAGIGAVSLSDVRQFN
ncbi:flagellar hook assembly protein FlgD [Aurantivibrio plasticivorans]